MIDKTKSKNNSIYFYLKHKKQENTLKKIQTFCKIPFCSKAQII